MKYTNFGSSPTNMIEAGETSLEETYLADREKSSMKPTRKQQQTLTDEWRHIKTTETSQLLKIKKKDEMLF
jgi:hypothetical protein